MSVKICSHSLNEHNSVSMYTLERFKDLNHFFMEHELTLCFSQSVNVWQHLDQTPAMSSKLEHTPRQHHTQKLQRNWRLHPKKQKICKLNTTSHKLFFQESPVLKAQNIKVLYPFSVSPDLHWFWSILIIFFLPQVLLPPLWFSWCIAVCIFLQSNFQWPGT